MTSETFEMKQENKLGSQSTQIALQNNYYGMDYQNTKSLCQDLIRNELEKYICSSLHEVLLLPV